MKSKLSRSRHRSFLAVLCGLAAAFCGVAGAQAEDAAPTVEATSPTAAAASEDASLPTETIEIWEERPDKPFDRDTELRLTGEELAQRGVTNLAEALVLIPELQVRTAGRGGQQIDIRGARKGSIKILIDGVAVDDPYYGNFDVSSIPVTDIVQIRVSTSPASPLDGTGGPGGVVEVHTRNAIGARRVEAQVLGTSLPSAEVAATARHMLGRHLALRLSARGTLGDREFALTAPMSTVYLDEAKRGASGGARLEYRRGRRRIVADAWAQRRSYVVPPGDDGSLDVLLIDDEQSARIGISADDRVGKLRVQLRTYAQSLSRSSIVYDDVDLAVMLRQEQLRATRIGVAALANRPLGKRVHVIASAAIDSENADVTGFDDRPAAGRTSIAELAAGAQAEWTRLRIDTAAGVAVPMGIGAAPWPEAKLTARYRFDEALTIKLVGARKGRTPTLRERYRYGIGNAALGPVHATFGELDVELTPAPWIALQVGSYVRRSNGLIRFDQMQSKLVNEGELDVRGVDARLTLRPTKQLSAGGSWNFADAYSYRSGTDPLDFFPRHRGDLWLTATPRARLGGTARVRIVGERLDRGNTLPRTATLDLSGFTRVGSLLGTIRVDNLLDARYEVRSGVLAPGRVFMASLRADWE